jgi:hypothetical protein
LTLTRLTLAQLALAQLTLTRSRLTLVQLTLARLNLARLTLTRLTLSPTTTAALAAVDNVAASGSEFGIAADPFGVATDIVSASMDSCGKAVPTSQTTWKAEVSAAIHSRLEGEQSAAAFIHLNCFYTVKVTEHAWW